MVEVADNVIEFLVGCSLVVTEANVDGQSKVLHQNSLGCFRDVQTSILINEN
jgi:hypothetical protein